MSRLTRPLIHAAIALAATVVLIRPMAAQRITKERAMTHSHTMHHVEIPPSMRAEHEEIHDALERATLEPGRVGDAARTLARVLHPHFEREARAVREAEGRSPRSLAYIRHSGVFS